MRHMFKVLTLATVMLGSSLALAADAPEPTKLQESSTRVADGSAVNVPQTGDRVELNRVLKASYDLEIQDVSRLSARLDGNLSNEAQAELQREISERKEAGHVERLNLQLNHARAHGHLEQAAKLETSLERLELMKTNPSALMQPRLQVRGGSK